ncbi:MAG: transcriptional repressor LexA [Magnetococcales bacterium]|nr:transcriptional repressor LexA [Magnetococcales bacterium]
METRGRKPVQGITPTLQGTLDYIQEYIDKHGKAPTLREIADARGISETSVHEQLVNLERKSFIKRVRHQPRALRILNNPRRSSSTKKRRKKIKEEPRKRLKSETSSKGQTAPRSSVYVTELRDVPIVGEVAAGVPILAQENRVGELQVEAHIVRGNCFALSVQGDSMIDVQINDSDYVIVRQQPIAENGEIVVALLGDEATVKHLYIDGEQIELRPANDAYKPIEVQQDDELRILGKVVAVRHRQ